MLFRKKNIFALAFLVFAELSFAEPKITQHYKYYDVYGNDPIAIRLSMNKQRKTKVKGGYDAYVSWFLRWRFKYDDDLKGCRITEVSTYLKVNYTLPRLSNFGNKSKHTLAHWQRYYNALLEHEYGHRDWGAKAALAIESKLLAMPHYLSCPDLRAEAHRRASNVLAIHLRGEKNYDRVTRHGATQGAIFP